MCLPRLGSVELVQGITVPKIEIESKIVGDPDQISSDLLTMRGVNYELLPIVKMSAPAEWANKPINEWPLGQEIFTSTILLFGLVPIDLHKFKLRNVDKSVFQESSRSLMNKHRTEGPCW